MLIDASLAINVTYVVLILNNYLLSQLYPTLLNLDTARLVGALTLEIVGRKDGVERQDFDAIGLLASLLGDSGLKRILDAHDGRRNHFWGLARMQVADSVCKLQTLNAVLF